MIILCFPNSDKIKEYFESYPYVISFEYFNAFNLKKNILKEFQKASIEFIIDFIKNFSNKTLKNDIKNIFELTKETFLSSIKLIKNEINCKDFIILSNNKNIIF